MQNKKNSNYSHSGFVIILGVCLYYAYPFQSSIKLGLDLKGGTQIILKPSEIGAESNRCSIKSSRDGYNE